MTHAVSSANFCLICMKTFFKDFQVIFKIIEIQVHIQIHLQIHIYRYRYKYKGRNSQKLKSTKNSKMVKNALQLEHHSRPIIGKHWAVNVIRLRNFWIKFHQR